MLEMSSYEREYNWYLTGCSRLSQLPIKKELFFLRWQEFESHAEKLREADSEGTVAVLDAKNRREMESMFNHDPFVRAVLIGMSEDN